jgi:hypothetical protein
LVFLDWQLFLEDARCYAACTNQVLPACFGGSRAVGELERLNTKAETGCPGYVSGREAHSWSEVRSWPLVHLSHLSQGPG